jgi:hypothetical protein
MSFIERLSLSRLIVKINYSILTLAAENLLSLNSKGGYEPPILN